MDNYLLTLLLAFVDLFWISGNFLFQSQNMQNLPKINNFDKENWVILPNKFSKYPLIIH